MDITSQLSTFLAAGGGEEGHKVTVNFIGTMVYFGLVLAVVFGLLSVARKGFRPGVFQGRLANWSEQLYLFIENLCVSIIGSHGRKYVPFIITFWLIIFISNLVALFFPTSPTALLSFNLGMAIISIFYVQWEGIKQNGFIGHFSHFAGPKLGGALVLISVMLFFIELVSETMKMVSLSLRLYGNIHGGHEAVHGMNQITSAFPMGELLIPVKMLTVVVQALIFCLLTCVYISLVTHEPHDEHHGEAHAH
ncbi:MAG: F0F1 ATP synthase subunit A [Chthonomonas sp.]|nr:F0F1 ATP synthase subunit A [Chthonomonas sp.]